MGQEGYLLVNIPMSSDSLRVSKYLQIKVLQGRADIKGSGAEDSRNPILYLSFVVSDKVSSTL